MEHTGPVARATAWRRRALPVILIGASLVTAACSSSGSTNAGGSAGATAEAASSCVSNAASVAKLDLASAGSTTSPYPATSVDGSAVKGKTYWLIVLTLQSPPLAAFAQGFKAAAQAAGAQAHVFDGMSSPATAAQGINSAIAAKASGIVLEVIDPSTVAEPLKAAAAAGIPVVDGFSGDPAETLVDGIVGATSPSEIDLGTMQADYALYATGCKLNLAIVTSLDVSTDVFAVNSAQAEIKRLCSSCTSTIINVPAADIPTETDGQVQTALQRDPKINFIMQVSDTFAPYIFEAQKALHVKIPMIGFDGDGVGYGMQGNPQVADVLYPPQPVVGWFLFDGIVRAAAGQKDFHITEPIVIVDKSTWGTNSSSASLQPRYADYQQSFMKLWGLSS
jgi:ribose transport system substrate-binding protein